MEEQKTIVPESQEQKTNAQKIWGALVKHKKEYLKSLPIAFVIACLYALGLPNYYQAKVVVVPESGGGEMGSLASIASSMGFSLGGSKGEDAITPTLYPDFMSSVAFTTSLFDIKVQMDSDSRVMTYYEYLSYEQKSPWWDKAISTVTGIFKSKKKNERKSMGKVNPFRLTPDQNSMVLTIQDKVKWDVGKRNDMLTIKVNDQDPLVAATVADSVRERLQDALTEYRTRKARYDLKYIEDLYKEAKEKYDKSCALYAEFSDANQGIMLETVRLRQTKLENDMQLYYNNFTALSSQLLAAKAKVQEKTPAFATLYNATVPLGNAGPMRKRIVLMWLLLVFLCHSAWILHKEDQLKLLFDPNKLKRH